jgi:phospholipase A1
LDSKTDCGTFNIRGYKPISLSWVHGNRVNTAPQSGNDTRDVAPANAQAYERNETRIQLSVRSKLASGMLFSERGGQHDSLWFGYTQQSYWQLFNAELSRTFRTTDHEPELIYIAPTPLDLPWGWRWSYTGLSLNHQSNGQTLPLSRSWNRLILMTGLEKDERYSLGLRLWQRLSDADGNDSTNINAQDDNPGIEDTYGRAELVTAWHLDRGHSLAMTLRHNLRPETERGGFTSWRMEWLRPLDRQSPGLRLHVQLFSGYGDSLIDYNYRRTTFSIGLSLVDF